MQSELDVDFQVPHHLYFRRSVGDIFFKQLMSIFFRRLLLFGTNSTESPRMNFPQNHNTYRRLFPLTTDCQKSSIWFLTRFKSHDLANIVHHLLTPDIVDIEFLLSTSIWWKFYVPCWELFLVPAFYWKHCSQPENKQLSKYAALEVGIFTPTRNQHQQPHGRELFPIRSFWYPCVSTNDHDPTARFFDNVAVNL